MQGTTASRVVGLVALWVLPAVATGSSFTTTGDGEPLRWPSDDAEGRPWLPVAVQTSNTSDLDPEQVGSAVARGLERWTSAADDAMAYDVWVGDDPDVFLAQQAYDGLSSIFFASAAPTAMRPEPHVAGHTQVWFDPDTGRILEADVVLNDVDWRFTADAEEADYAGSGGRLALDDVLQHELGHAWGLGHSGLVDATMFAAAWSGQGTPHCDDVTAMRVLYGADRDTGALSGRVVGPRGPIVGAHVTAVSLGHAAPFASTTSALDGTFRIDGLPSGDHVLWIDPSAAGLTPPPQRAPCRIGQPARTPILQEGRLRRFPVTADVEHDVGNLELACTPDGGAAIPALPDALPSEAAIAASLPLDETRIVQLEGLEGPTIVTAIAWSLWSPVDLDVTVQDAHGTPIDATYDGTRDDLGGRDVRLAIAPPGDGKAQIVLRAKRLTSRAWPLGGLSDPTPYVVLLVSPDRPKDGCTPLFTATPRPIQEGVPFRRGVNGVAASVDPPRCGCDHATSIPAPWLLLALARRRARRRHGG